MAKFATGKRGPIELISPVIAGSGGFPERQDCRESLGSPEYCLAVESLSRISREKTTPIYFGIDEARHPIAQRLSGF